MENQKSNSILFAILGFILVLLLIFGVFVFAQVIARDKNNIDNGLNDEIENDVGVRNMVEFELYEANEEHSFEGLDLIFTATNDGSSGYEYVLEVSYGGNTLGVSDYLDNKIWSSDRAASFAIYRIDDVFVLNSFRAAQCDSDTLIIINTNGEILKTFENVSLSIDNDRISISDTLNCMVEDSEENFKSYTYQAVGNNIVMF